MRRFSCGTSRSLFVVIALVGAITAPASGQTASELLDSAEAVAEAEAFDRADYSWTLQTLHGEKVSLAQYAGKVLFMNIWATWCAPCIEELRTVAALRDSLSNTDVEFLLVSPEEPRHVRRFLRRFRHHRHLPVLVEYHRMPGVFELEAVPTSYIFDRSGRIVLKLRGTTNWDTAEARNLLRALAAESP